MKFIKVLFVKHFAIYKFMKAKCYAKAEFLSSIYYDKPQCLSIDRSRLFVSVLAKQNTLMLLGR